METATDQTAELLKERLGQGLPPGVAVKVDIHFVVSSADFGETYHRTRESAITYKKMTDAASGILDILPRVDDPDSEFANGKGFVQHVPTAVECFKENVRGFIERHYVEEGKYTKELILGWFDGGDPRLLAVLNDGDPVLRTLCTRAFCIDEDAREWGQPGFAKKNVEGWERRREEPFVP